MRELTIECAHDLCNCNVIAPVGGAEVFCSDYCQDVDEQSIESETCACGHPPCDEP